MLKIYLHDEMRRLEMEYFKMFGPVLLCSKVTQEPAKLVQSTRQKYGSCAS